MFFNDHNPPHVHVKYAEYKVLIRIDNGDVYAGSAPSKVLRMMREWMKLHREELIHNWDLCRKDIPPLPVAPLD